MTNHDSRKFWFKRRRYGWGWMPTAWQGWVSMIVAMGIIVIASLQLPAKPNQPTNLQLSQFFAAIAFAIAFIMVLGYLKGPAPHWRWGWKPGDDPDEDL